MIRFALGLAAALLPTASNAVPLQDENLLQSYPAGFKIGWSTQKGTMSMAEAVAAPDTVENWNRMITTQVFRDNGRIRYSDMVAALTSRFAAGCPGSVASPVHTSVENGYFAVNFAIHCPLFPATGKPEQVLFKFIRGMDAFYSVQYAYRAKQSDKDDAQIGSYLDTIMVCDTRSKDHPCPKLTPLP